MVFSSAPKINLWPNLTDLSTELYLKWIKIIKENELKSERKTYSLEEENCKSKVNTHKISSQITHDLTSSTYLLNQR